MRPILALLLLAGLALAAGPEFPLTADSKPQPTVPKGTMLKDTYTAGPKSVFPGTQREYQIYLPAGHDKTKPSAFMVFQDGVIYQAPVVFDNLIARKDIPPLVGIFIKPGVVPAANESALPRFNRSYEYDSVSEDYSEFLIEEFLPAIKAKHGLKLSADPNHAAIAGSSSGGICAFMVAWHRPDHFRRVFTSVGTYVGIHGADQLPVWVRKYEPKPLRVFLQSGTHDGNGYCGDWWMANQMMERSLAWAGYEVNHAWGEGGHDQKHASQVFPDVLRWLWHDWQTSVEVKANVKGESKWKGGEVVEAGGEWLELAKSPAGVERQLVPVADGRVFVLDRGGSLYRLEPQRLVEVETPWKIIRAACATREGNLRLIVPGAETESNANMLVSITPEGVQAGNYVRVRNGTSNDAPNLRSLCCAADGTDYFTDWGENMIFWSTPKGKVGDLRDDFTSEWGPGPQPCLSPDQTQLYVPNRYGRQMEVGVLQIKVGTEAPLQHGEWLYRLERMPWLEDSIGGLCVDTEGRLYVATSAGIQVCDQAGRVNFIIPTPGSAHDVCFGSKDLSELYITCGDTVYKRPTKAKGVISGQQAPVKPAAPKL